MPWSAGALLCSVSLTQKSRLTASSTWSITVVGTECICFLEYGSCSVVSASLQPHGLYSRWNSPGQNTGVGSLSLFQGIFPTQGSNPGLPHCRWILYQLSHKGSPRILEWVAYPFSKGSSWPRNRTGVSCITGIFFTNWASYFREVILGWILHYSQPKASLSSTL